MTAGEMVNTRLAESTKLTPSLKNSYDVIPPVVVSHFKAMLSPSVGLLLSTVSVGVAGSSGETWAVVVEYMQPSETLRIRSDKLRFNLKH